MAKVDSPDPLGVFLNPAAYSRTREEIKKDRNKPPGASRKSLFSTLLGTEKSLTALGAPPDLPVSGETLNQLMDDVRATGDDLRNRPFPDEILRYKRAVRDFMYYVVKNGFQIQESEGIPKFLKPGYTGPRGTPESWERKAYTQIQIIDKKLEDMAAIILTSQINQLELASRLEEITGLLVDLFQ
ncbi:MAG: YaaR family protein [Treponema sp.]|jgi:uncharacterized protein YaaR (DUF327 family)|nr:YaaR family protein [Treponema sp.]